MRYDDVPRELNLTTWFVDRNVDEGRGDDVAIIGPAGPCTYVELAALVNRIGHVLRDLGVRQEDRVLLALSDSVEFVATWYAAQKIGAVTAEVYTFLLPKDYAYYLDYTRAEVVVVDEVTLGPMREAARASRHVRTLLVVGGLERELRAGEVAFEALVGQAAEVLEAAPTTRDDIAIWKFTTGSTGRPKACVHPARSPLLSHEWYARGVLDIRGDDRVLPVPKLFFGYARDLTALFPFGVGATGIVFPERTTPEVLFDLIRRHRPTILVNVPTMMQAMLDHPGAAAQDLSCLRLCTSAGEALPPALQRRWIETFGVEVLDGIGSSEAYHIYISNSPASVRAGSIGKLVPGYSARVVDEDGRDVTDGETGRLWIDGDTAALLYWNDLAKSKETFAGTLVKSGDLVMRDADGYFWYRGRADDLLKVGGVWIAPTEIEQCLGEHPDVIESAAVGLERDGLIRICAFVVIRSHRSVTAEALRDFVRERLSPHKVPREVRHVSALPRTGSGKVDRRALLDVAMERDPVS